MRIALKLLSFLAVGLVLVVVIAAVAVYRLVRVGEIHQFLSAQIEKQTGLSSRLGAAELEFGWITGVAFNDVELSEPGSSSPVISAQRVTARVALLPLLRRQLVFYEIRLRGPTAKLVREADGRIPMLDRLLNLPFFQEQGGEFNFDIRSIQVQHGDILLTLHRRDGAIETWRAPQLDLDIERLRGTALAAALKKLFQREPLQPDAAALAFELKSQLVRNGATMNLKADGQLAFPDKALLFHQAHWIGDIEVVNFPASLLVDFGGARLPVKSMSGYVAQRVHIEGNPATRLRAKGTFEFRQLSIDAPELLLTPLAGLDAQVSFAIERKPQEMQLTKGELRTKDLSVSLQGSIVNMESNDPRLKLALSSTPAPAAALIKVLPLKLFGSAELERAVTAIQAGQLQVNNASIQSTLSGLRNPSVAVGRMFWDAELREFAARGSGAALPLRVARATLKFADGVLRVAEGRGAYGDSRFDQIDATYDLAGAARGRLDIEAHGDINLAELKDQTRAFPAGERIYRVLSLLEDLSGRAKVGLTMRQVPGEAILFGGKMSVEQARFRYGDIVLSEARGDFTLTPDEIAGERLRAQFAGSPIQARLMIKEYALPEGVFDLSIDSPGMRAGTLARLLLDTGNLQDPGIVRGGVRYFGALHDSKRRKLTGDLDLFNVQLLFRPLLQPLRELNGKIRIDEEGIDFQNLRALLVGVPASASGRWRYAGAPQLTFDFAAPSLDITYLISQLDPESSPFYANLVAEGKIALAKGRIKNFEFGDLQTQVNLTRRVWRLTQLSARSAGGTIQGVTTIFDRPETLGLATEPRVQGVPVQSFLRWFDVATTEMTGSVTLSGKLETVGKNDSERKQNLNGGFNLKIEDGTIHRMRILVQILNLLDLSRWFTFQLPDLAKDGIRFRAISGDFKVTKGVYSTQNLLVDSNDLRMTGVGKIDVPKDEIDFVIAVRPFAGIDSALSYIPLIGRGVAAIKNSFLVASFNIQGPIDNPTITPAPLGTLNEWFWGVLGIPKNMIGLGESDNRETPAPKQPAP